MDGVSPAVMATKPSLLALFYARLGDSRLAEFEAVWTRRGAPVIQWCWDDRPVATQGGDVGPRIIQSVPALDDVNHGQLADTAAQSVACRGVFEVWGAGETLADCVADTTRLPTAHIRHRITGSWRVESLTLGTRQRRHSDRRIARMAAFGWVLDAIEDRPVDLTTPAHRLWLVEVQRFLQDARPLPEPPPRHLLLFQLSPRIPPVQDRMAQLALRKRAFLSTSTLPVDRSLQLCNLALARAPARGATLLDPYCGSGGVLLAAAALGAETVGSDLDWRMVSDHRWPVRIPPSVHRPARGIEAVRMRDNFDEAGLPQPKALLTLDVGAEDAAERLLEANGGQRYHALVCDPPYGRREFQHGEEAWDGALTFKVHEAALAGTLDTLIQLAGDTLLPEGRLVFLVPVRSPKDPNKPSLDALRTLLRARGRAQGLRLVHLGVEILHRGLHRAVVVMARDSASGRLEPMPVEGPSGTERP